MDEIFQTLGELERQKQNAVLCLVTESKGSTPRKAGSKMLVFPDGETKGSVGGGKIEWEVIEEAKKLMFTNGSKVINFQLTEDLEMQCGGAMSVYFEAINSAPRLLIFGAGHIGQILAKMAVDFGFDVHLIDNRDEIFSKPVVGVKNLLKEFPDAWQNMDFLPTDFVVITTYKHTYDEDIVAHVLQQPHAYVGMMASKRKASIAKKNWLEMGIEQEKIDQVFSPIGMNIQCETPREIALSILAQLVDELNKKRKSHE